MNKNEKVEFVKAMDSYSRKHQLRDYFAALINDLVVSQPKDPIDFLIDKLNNRRKQRLIFINYYETQISDQISTAISNSFNFKLIKASEVGKEAKRATDKADYLNLQPERISQFISESLAKVEPLYKGIIVSGFPNQPAQLDFIVKKGFIPERLFVVEINKNRLEDYYKKIHNHAPKQQLQSKIQRNSIWQRDLLSFANLNATLLKYAPKQELIGNIKSILSLKDKKITPITSIRVMILHPPFIRFLKSGLDVPSFITKKYGLVSITLQNSVKGEVQKWVKSKGQFTPQIQLSIVHTRCLSTEARDKGWLLSGWPRDISQTYFFDDIRISPHLIVLLDDSKEVLNSIFTSIPQTCDLFTINPKPSLAVFEQSLKRWNLLKQWVTSNLGGKVQNVRLGTETQQNVARAIEAQLMNPKVYS